LEVLLVGWGRRFFTHPPMISILQQYYPEHVEVLDLRFLGTSVFLPEAAGLLKGKDECVLV